MSNKSNPIAIRCTFPLAILATMIVSGLALAEDPSGPRALSRAFRDAAKLATPSVVTVISYGQNTAQADASDALDLDPAQPKDLDDVPSTKELLPATGLGSGVIISGHGLIITNNHVVNGAQRVIVRLHDGFELTVNEVIGDSASDVALLRVETEEQMIPAQIGDSKDLEIGEWVLAIGSPFRLDATVSAGIISAIGRRLPSIRRVRLLQTDAAINPGNSGGPLINLDGEVIGISTAIATRSGGYQGIGFAIPINQARWIANELDQHGEVRRASMGVGLVALTPRISKQLNLPMQSGILVASVTRDGPADKAGVKQHDVIVELNAEPIVKPRDLQHAIEREPIDSEQKLKVFRDGKSLELTVRLEEAG